MDVCRKLLDSICRFSFLKRCSYSLYLDTMLNIGYVSNETNADVRMDIEEFILVEIWIHCCTKLNWITLENTLVFICVHATIAWAKWEMLLEVNWQWRVHRITIAWETMRTNVWIVIPLFALRLTPVSVNGNLHWLLLIKQLGKLLNVIPGVSTFIWQDERWI